MYEYFSHNAQSSPCCKIYRPSYSLTANCRPHTHSVGVMNGDIMHYVGIFGVPLMGVLGIYETTKMKPGFVAH